MSALGPKTHLVYGRKNKALNLQMCFVLLHIQSNTNSRKKKDSFRILFWFQQQPAAQIDIWQKGSDGTHSTSMLSKIPHRFKVTVWESSLDLLPHHWAKKPQCTPTLWLCIFHFCTLRLSFLFVLSYYYYQGNFWSHPLTQQVPLSHIMMTGFNSTFLCGGVQYLPPLEEGGYPKGPDVPKHQAWVSRGKGCLSLSGLTPGGFDNVFSHLTRRLYMK